VLPHLQKSVRVNLPIKPKPRNPMSALGLKDLCP